MSGDAGRRTRPPATATDRKGDEIVGPVTARVLAELAHHHDERLPFGAGERLQWLSDDLVPDSGIFITSREFNNVAPDSEDAVEVHDHPVPQIYLLMGEPGALEARVSIDGDDYTCVSPATVFIPAGARHRLSIIRGTGTAVAILLSGTYGDAST
jgi:hypothetical protein